MVETMQVIPQKDADISALVEALRAGQIIVYPTETCYGLGCDATNADAVRRVYAMKGRPKDKPLLVIASSLDRLRLYVEITDRVETIAKRYWPGALTVIVRVKPGVRFPRGVLAPDQTIACRVTDHPFARKLVESLGRPLVSTSANAAGGPNPYTIADVLAAFRESPDQPDLIIDAGTLLERPPSTIIRIADNITTVIRQGDVYVST